MLRRWGLTAIVMRAAAIRVVALAERLEVSALWRFRAGLGAADQLGSWAATAVVNQALHARLHDLHLAVRRDSLAFAGRLALCQQTPLVLTKSKTITDCAITAQSTLKANRLKPCGRL